MVKHYSRNRVGYEPDNEYYTPPEVFSALGLHFDLDVCAPEGGIPWLPATNHYSIKDDGLLQPWNGRVWMNPPYSKPGPWIERFIAHRNGVCLTQVSKSSAFRNLWQSADGIVIPQTSPLSQSKFVHGSGRKTVFMPVALFAFGSSCVEALETFGRVR